MSFGDHLEELRMRVLLSLAAPIPLAVATFFVSDWIIEWMVRPLHRAQLSNGLEPVTQLLTVAEYLVLQFKLSLILAVVISAPWVLYQAWLFIKPGLYQHERRFVYLLVPGSAALIAAGLALLYFAMLPLMLQVLVSAGSREFPAPDTAIDSRLESILSSRTSVPVVMTAPENPRTGDVWMLWPSMEVHAAVSLEGASDSVEILKVPRIRAATVEQKFRLTWYINFVLLLMLAMTIAVQLPLVVLLLGWLGLVSRGYLKRQRKYALMGCAVLAAIITPTPDAFSMLIMLVPLYGLYELGILLLWLAPASRVADGRVLSLKRADYAVAHGAETAEDLRTVKTGAREADNTVSPRSSGRAPEDGE